MDRLKFAFVALLVASPAAAQQCGTLTTCPPVSTPLAGTELLYTVQGGVSKKMTVTQLGLALDPYFALTPGVSPIVPTTNGGLLWDNNGKLADSLAPLQTALPSLAANQIYGGTGAAGAAQHFPAGTGVATALGNPLDGTGGLASHAGVATALPSLTTSQLYGGTGAAGAAQLFPAGAGVPAWLLAPTSANLAAAVTDKTGTGPLVFGIAPTITLPNATGLPIAGISGLGTGVGTALGNPLDGTGGLASHAGVATALPSLTTSQLYGGTGAAGAAQLFPAGAGVPAWLLAPTSANLAAAVTDKTGTGPLVFGIAPTITLPNATGLPIAGISGLGTGVGTALGNTLDGTGGLASHAGVATALPSLTTSQLYGGTGGAGVAQHFPAGTGVETALQQNIGAAGAPVLFNGAGGKPSSIDLSNGTGTPGSVTPLTSVTATFFARTATAPCDLISGGCASAWSVTRLMRAAYAGYLFQVQRLSDNTTQNIGLNSAGAVDTTTLSNFCFATTCVVKTLYDQVGSNNLAQATLAKMPSLIIGDGQALPYVYTTNTGNYPNNTYLEQTTTSGLPTGAASKTINMVGKIQYSNCCGGFGMTENPAATDGGVSEAGQMFSLVWLNAAANGYWYNGYAGTWAFGVDVEQGYNWGAISPSDGNTYGEIKYNSVGNTITAILNGATVFSGQSPLYTINTGSRLALGSAGDNTPVQNVFYEGFIASAFTSTANDEAVYQNQLAFYNGGVKSPPSQLVANCGVSACAVLNAYAIPDIAYVLNQALSGGHQWAMEASATGSGSIGGAGGLTFHDGTAPGDRLGIDANGQVIIPNGLRISNIPGPTNTASLTAKNCGTLVEPAGSTAFTLTLPAATAVAGCEYSIWNNDSSAVTLNGGGNNLNGPYGNSGATEILSPLAFVIVQSDGYNWIVLLATNMGFTIGNLPSCGGSTKGARLYVTNAQTTPTFLGTVSTTGSVVAPVFCNGSNWIYGLLDTPANDNLDVTELAA